MARARKAPPESAPTAPTALTPSFDYEVALARGHLNSDEIDAIVDLLPKTNSALEISTRLHLPQKLVSEALEDPRVLESLVARARLSGVQWFLTTGILRLQEIIKATNDPDVFTKNMKLLGEWLDIPSLNKSTGRKPGRPKDPRPPVNVAVQVNNGPSSYEQAIRDKDGAPPVVAALLPEGAASGEDEDDDSWQDD